MSKNSMRPFVRFFVLVGLLLLTSCARQIGTTYMADPKPKTPIISNLKYPAEAIQKKLEGKVIVAAF
ncbi:MAG TPA: hypothetical protein VFH43_04310, partial [Candidatus Kapabacteria bacterium]|nr:hypothetical protein [Candidatus Kapabacteria bacterium]